MSGHILHHRDGVYELSNSQETHSQPSELCAQMQLSNMFYILTVPFSPAKCIEGLNSQNDESDRRAAKLISIQLDQKIAEKSLKLERKLSMII